MPAGLGPRQHGRATRAPPLHLHHLVFGKGQHSAVTQVKSALVEIVEAPSAYDKDLGIVALYLGVGEAVGGTVRPESHHLLGTVLGLQPHLESGRVKPVLGGLLCARSRAIDDHLFPLALAQIAQVALYGLLIRAVGHGRAQVPAIRPLVQHQGVVAAQQFEPLCIVVLEDE